MLKPTVMNLTLSRLGILWALKQHGSLSTSQLGAALLPLLQADRPAARASDATRTAFGRCVSMQAQKLLSSQRIWVAGKGNLRYWTLTRRGGRFLQDAIAAKQAAGIP